MNERDAKKLMVEVMAAAEAAILTTIDGEGLPCTRAMLNLRNPASFPGLAKAFQGYDDDFLVYFTTNTSSSKVKQITENPAVSVYYCLPGEWRGLMLGGRIEVVTDQKEKERLWQDGWEMYYPQGPSDPDYAILRLLPDVARYYHQLEWFTYRPGGKK